MTLHFYFYNQLKLIDFLLLFFFFLAYHSVLIFYSCRLWICVRGTVLLFHSTSAVLDLGEKQTHLFSLQLFYSLPLEVNLWRNGRMISMHLYMINDVPTSLSSPMPLSTACKIIKNKKIIFTLPQMIKNMENEWNHLLRSI